MDQFNSTTQHQKGKHLSFVERVIIQTRLNDKHSPNKIAAELGCSPNTVRNEIKRGTIYLYNGKVARYKADAGQKTYEENRANSCRPLLLAVVYRIFGNLSLPEMANSGRMRGIF